MLIHLLSDLIKEPALQEEFSQSPNDVLSKYGMNDASGLGTSGFDGLLGQVGAELKSQLGNKAIILGWPNPGDVKINDVEPFSKKAGEVLGAFDVTGINFDKITTIEEISFSQESKAIVKVKDLSTVKIDGDKMTVDFGDQTLEGGSYTFSLRYKQGNSVFGAQLERALMVK